MLHGGTRKAFIHEFKKGRAISCLKICYYWTKKDVRKYECFYRKIPKLQYDIAISYSLHSISLLQLINKYVEAPIKMVFVHNEPVMNVSRSGVTMMNERIQCVNNYNYICGVSAAVTNIFKKLFTKYSDKCITVYNFMDEDSVMTRANESIDEMKEGKVKILSVGRFTEQKNFTVIPSVCEELIKRNIDFKWYIVGDGDQKEIVQKVIDENGLNDRLILLGAKINPYPYYKACDIYCQPSKTEAYCTTINEARMLGKPIVATEFPGCREQLSDGQGGAIADNNAVAIADGIEKIVCMSDKEREKMLATAAYPNALERAAQNRFFEIIGQK